MVQGGDADTGGRAPGEDAARTGVGRSVTGAPSTDDDLSLEEAALLAAFDRLRPQGSLQWCFDDAMRRLDRPDHDSSAGALPWPGLPDDLWDRGRSARIGRRFAGDVTTVLAEILAADARAAADAAVSSLSGDRFEAAWHALHYLAARVEALEDRLDPAGVVATDLEVAPPDCSEWMETLTSWLGPELPAAGPLVVGEARDADLMAAAVRTGRRVVGVEPRGPVVWQALSDAGRSQTMLVLDEVAGYLAELPDDGAAGIVLAGCTDRLSLVDKVALIRDALRATAGGGRVVIFATDQEAWDRQLPPPARDLFPGRPLHPETWQLLLARLGAGSATWHRPAAGGSVHAIVSEVSR